MLRRALRLLAVTRPKIPVQRIAKRHMGLEWLGMYYSGLIFGRLLANDSGPPSDPITPKEAGIGLLVGASVLGSGALIFYVRSARQQDSKDNAKLDEAVRDVVTACNNIEAHDWTDDMDNGVVSAHATDKWLSRPDVCLRSTSAMDSCHRYFVRSSIYDSSPSAQNTPFRRLLLAVGLLPKRDRIIERAGMACIGKILMLQTIDTLAWDAAKESKGAFELAAAVRKHVRNGSAQRFPGETDADVERRYEIALKLCVIRANYRTNGPYDFYQLYSSLLVRGHGVWIKELQVLGRYSAMPLKNAREEVDRLTPALVDIERLAPKKGPFHRSAKDAREFLDTWRP